MAKKTLDEYERLKNQCNQLADLVELILAQKSAYQNDMTIKEFTEQIVDYFQQRPSQFQSINIKYIKEQLPSLINHVGGTANGKVALDKLVPPLEEFLADSYAFLMAGC